MKSTEELRVYVTQAGRVGGGVCAYACACVRVRAYIPVDEGREVGFTYNAVYMQWKMTDSAVSVYMQWKMTDSAVSVGWL